MAEFNTPPSLADLTARYMTRTGGVETAEMTADAEPYEVVAGFRTDARTAWAEATSVLKLLGVTGTATAPTDWANVVRQLPPVTALPLAVGHFPQQVSDLSGLMSGSFGPLPTATSISVTTYAAKAEKTGTPAAKLAAAAVARLTGEFGTAERLLADGSADARTNEQAALRWQQGRRDEAEQLWQTLPASAVRSFNLGLCRLVAGDRAAAKPLFSEASRQLPESNGWRNLAALYLALCESA